MTTFPLLAALAAAILLAPAAGAQGTGDGSGPAHGDHAQTQTTPLPDPETAWRLGDLTIAAPYSRATLPNAPVAGGFVTITNDGARDDRLIAAASPIAGRTEIHDMTMNGDVMTMRPLPDGLPVPAGGTVALQPGGSHLMFMQLTGPLVEGDSIEVTLTFDQAGRITVPLSVLAFNARSMDAGGDGADPHAGH